MKQPELLFIISLCALMSCQQNADSDALPEAKAGVSITPPDPAVAPPIQITRKGKLKDAARFQHTFETSPLQDMDLPIIDGAMVAALENQIKLLDKKRKRKKRRIGNLSIAPEQLEETIELLLSYQHTPPIDLYKSLEAHQIRGQDRRGNVKFTGYYTPIIKVNHRKKGRYQYPIYDRPKKWEGQWPSRRSIEAEGAFEGLDLELAYARDKLDIYYMQLQGSGYVAFPNGKKKLFAYNGNNRHPYRSIEKYLLTMEDYKINNLSIDGIKSFFNQHPQLIDSVLWQNPSFSFFSPKNAKPRGAGGVDLSSFVSIAVDPKYIPLGSCLLLALPQLDESGERVIGHQLQFAVAQDVGGAIKGPGHIDVYMGVGPKARAKAEQLHHYGQVWLLLPQKSKAPMAAASDK